ncbi:MAG: hypothetical protein IJ769_01230, partial [Clostridia bacterium]|nr:hypothetical protein [Clostridia bacterium]
DCVEFDEKSIKILLEKYKNKKIVHKILISSSSCATISLSNAAATEALQWLHSKAINKKMKKERRRRGCIRS